MTCEHGAEEEHGKPGGKGEKKPGGKGEKKPGGEETKGRSPAKGQRAQRPAKAAGSGRLKRNRTGR